MKRKLIFACLAATVLSVVSFSPVNNESLLLNKFSDPVIREIFDLKNERKTFLLLPYLFHEKATYREEAAMAFGTLQDTVVLNYLLPLLHDEDAGVRNATAFAIGQIGDSKLEGNLLNAFYAEKSPAIKATILKAMGKCANDRILISFNMLNPKDSVVQAGLAWGIYYAGLKGKTSEALLKKSIRFLGNTNAAETRFATAHFLSRAKDLDLAPFLTEISIALQSEPLGMVREPLCLALGKIQRQEAIDQLVNSITADPVPQVRQSAIKGLSCLDLEKIPVVVYQALGSKSINTAIAAAEFIKLKAQVADVPDILLNLEKVENWRVHAVMVAALLKVSPNSIIEEKIWSRYKKSKNNYEKGYLLTALAYNPVNNKDISKEIFQSKEPVVRTMGIEALVEACKYLDKDELKTEYYEIFKKAIESEDVSLIGNAADVLRNPELGFASFVTNPTYLFQARDRLKMPQEIETYQELQRTIDYVTKTSSKPHPITLPYSSIDWKTITPLSNLQRVLVKTSKGDFTMDLMVEDAPGTVANFLNLCGKNFFNGKKFHRVVPDFVVQGGDPRGDGWGSSEGIIRSEFNMHSFKEGYIGMASAGKDTESCQWFIMLSPAPHLDGRYTNFAKVISGMDVVQKLEVGDFIKGIDLNQ